MLTQEYLKQYFNYDPETGIFSRKIKTTSRASDIGVPIGSLDTKGYLFTRILGKYYLLHRLAWFYMTGKWPENEIDHKDLNKSNNKWENLREATSNQNKYNVKARSNNSSGFKGVSFDKRTQKWVAQITINGKNRGLGRFKTPEEASVAYNLEANKHHGEFERN